MKKTIIILALFVSSASVVLYSIRMSADGPIGPFPGGPLTSGELSGQELVDWSFYKDQWIELQSEQPPQSRTTGYIVYKKDLYIPVDQGFLWRRISSWDRFGGPLISSLRNWHKHVLSDGRVIIRAAGKRYERLAVLEDNPDVLDGLRKILEERVSRQWPAFDATTPGNPNEMWFFRLDPRPTAL